MTPEQCRAARKKLGWSVDGLASRVGGCRSTITFFDSGRNRLTPINYAWARLVFMEAGVDVDAL